MALHSIGGHHDQSTAHGRNERLHGFYPFHDGSRASPRPGERDELHDDVDHDEDAVGGDGDGMPRHLRPRGHLRLRQRPRRASCAGRTELNLRRVHTKGRPSQAALFNT